MTWFIILLSLFVGSFTPQFAGSVDPHQAVYANDDAGAELDPDG